MKDNLVIFLKRYPCFVFLLPVFFVLHGCTENYDFVPFKDAVLLTGLYILVSSAILVPAYFIYRNWHKAAWLTFALMAFHFFFGSMHDGLRKLFPQSFLSTYSFVIPASFCLFFIFAFLLKKRKKTFVLLLYYFNIVFLLLITIDMVSLLIKITGKTRISTPSLPKEATPCTDCPTPDFYFIIADEYAGNTELKDIFLFDNTAFLTLLQQQGFHVIEHSKSNYNYTPYSIASTLNMDYLDLTRTEKQPLLAYTYETIQNNQLLHFLEQHKYRFYNYTHFDFPGQPAQTAETFLPSKTKLITSQTFLSRMEKEISYHLITTLKWEKEIRKSVYFTKKNNELLYQLTIKAPALKTKEPKFVVTHLMMPHYPYYFDKNGNEFPFEKLTEGNQNNYNNYIEYLQYSNKRLLELIAQILKNSSSPPVIILMGDHGFRHFKGPVDTKYYFYNLSTVYLPGQNYSSFSDSLTNVNLIRTVLNSTFRQQLPYLKDTAFIMDNP
ncbi:MAG: sulfatase-like hydrolase/transferase [Chitinophagaceae bacterium]|nr:sulfatase-like hydrolase/transferase [Chitinophagaceae bacterium]